jgi:hypothetical protein
MAVKVWHASERIRGAAVAEDGSWVAVAPYGVCGRLRGRRYSYT